MAKVNLRFSSKKITNLYLLHLKYLDVNKMRGKVPKFLLPPSIGLNLYCNIWYLAVLSQYEVVIDVIGSVEGIDAFIY